MMQGPGNAMQSRFGPTSDPFAAFGQQSPASTDTNPPNVIPTATAIETPLSSFPLLSAAAASPLVSTSDDGALLPAVVARLVVVNGSLPAASPHRLSADDILALEALPSMLQAATIGGLAAPTGTANATNDPRWARVLSVVSLAFREWPRALSAIPALDLLRAMALVPEGASLLFSLPCDASVPTDRATAASGDASAMSDVSAGPPTPRATALASARPDSVVWDVIEALHAVAVAASSAGPNAAASSAASNVFGGPAADALALALLCNAPSTAAGRAWALSDSVLPRLADIITLRYLASGMQGGLQEAAARPCRALAATLALNLAGCCPVSEASGSGVGDIPVQLLLGLLQALPGEPAPDVQRTMLLVSLLPF